MLPRLLSSFGLTLTTRARTTQSPTSACAKTGVKAIGNSAINNEIFISNTTQNYLVLFAIIVSGIAEE